MRHPPALVPKALAGLPLPLLLLPPLLLLWVMGLIGLRFGQILCMRVQPCADLRDAAMLYRSLRYFRADGRKVIKPFSQLIFMSGANDEVVVDFAATQAIKASHFGDLEAAVPCDPSQLSAYDAHACSRADWSSGPVDLLTLPALVDVEGQFRALPPNKAPGPSGVPNELWKVRVQSSARTWFAPLLKSHIRLTEPARLSTGLLVALFKNKGSPHDVANYRSIFLLEGVGKASRTCLRGSMVQKIAGEAPPLFQGCVPRSSLAQLTHYVTTLLHLAGVEKGCCALQFIDVQSAYYSVYRPHLADSLLDDERLCQILARLRVPPSMVDEVRRWAAGPPLLSGLPEHHIAYVRALFRAPTFVLAGHPLLHRSQAGTRPGDSIADVLFAMVMSDAMRGLRSRLRSEGLQQGPGDGCLAQPLWADDAVVPTWSRGTSAFGTAIQATAQHVHHDYSRRIAVVPCW